MGEAVLLHGSDGRLVNRGIALSAPLLPPLAVKLWPSCCRCRCRHAVVLWRSAQQPSDAVPSRCALRSNHHKYPQDGERLVFPPLPACLPAAVIYGSLCACLPRVRAAESLTEGCVLGCQMSLVPLFVWQDPLMNAHTGLPRPHRPPRSHQLMQPSVACCWAMWRTTACITSCTGGRLLHAACRAGFHRALPPMPRADCRPHSH